MPTALHFHTWHSSIPLELKYDSKRLKIKGLESLERAEEGALAGIITQTGSRITSLASFHSLRFQPHCRLKIHELGTLTP